jgi:hypothetical protein
MTAALAGGGPLERRLARADVPRQALIPEVS